MIEKVKQLWPDWEIVDNLGGGSFGQVYEINRDIFGQIDKAAVKVLSIPKNKGEIQELRYNGYDDASITAHYKDQLVDIVKEYNLMAQLKGCANVVHCEDVRYIQSEDGIGWDVYIKMELLEPLVASLTMPVDEQQVIKIGVDICNALILCKEKGIIHRDIKPQNLFISDDGTYKLGDFGIAKTIERTMGGTRTGTYNYMAPEVYNNQPQGTALDQYSLGMVLYWILNNRRVPFMPAPPAIPTASQEEQARMSRMSGSLPIPEPANGSRELKTVVLKAIAHNPRDRYASPEAFREALREVIKTSAYDIEEKSVLINEPSSFWDYSGYEENSIQQEETEFISMAEKSFGNAWSFSEVSVKMDSSWDSMFQDTDLSGTIGINNTYMGAANGKQAGFDENRKENISFDRMSPAKPIVIPDYYSLKDRNKVYFYYDLLRTLIDRANVDQAIEFCKIFMSNGDADDKKQAEKFLQKCEEIKRGVRNQYCAKIDDCKNRLNRFENDEWAWQYVANLDDFLGLNPYDEEMNQWLNKAYHSPVSKIQKYVRANPLLCARKTLQEDFTNGKAYIEIGNCYLNRGGYDNCELALWYFKKGISLLKEKNAAYGQILGQYAHALAVCCEIDQVESILKEAETYGFSDGSRVRKILLEEQRKRQNNNSKDAGFSTGRDRTGLSKSIKLPGRSSNRNISMEDTEDFILSHYFSFGFNEVLIDQTNVEDAITLCMLKLKKDNYSSEAERMMKYCLEIKSGKKDCYCGKAEDTAWLRHYEAFQDYDNYLKALNELMEYDPYHKELNEKLKQVFQDQKMQPFIQKNKYIKARKALQEDFTNGKAYIEIGNCYLKENNVINCQKAIWYFERGISHLKRTNALSAEAFEQYALALAGCGQNEKAEQVLREAESYGYQMKSKVKRQTKPKKAGLFGKIFG